MFSLLHKNPSTNIGRFVNCGAAIFEFLFSNGLDADEAQLLICAVCFRFRFPGPFVGMMPDSLTLSKFVRTWYAFNACMVESFLHQTLPEAPVKALWTSVYLETSMLLDCAWVNCKVITYCLLQENRLSLLQHEIEKVRNDVEKGRSELRFVWWISSFIVNPSFEVLHFIKCRYEIDKVAAGQRLDLNLERGYARANFSGLSLLNGWFTKVFILRICSSLMPNHNTYAPGVDVKCFLLKFDTLNADNLQILCLTDLVRTSKILLNRDMQIIFNGIAQ